MSVPSLIRIATAQISAAINPLGAELWSLHDAEGRALMTDADPAYWAGHAPLLFPIVGSLAGDSYRLEDGRQYTLPRHGFARRRAFSCIEHGGDHALFRLVSDAETLAVYPFPFRLDMAFRVADASVRTTATVTNEGAEPMPFSIGFHPAFAWPLPYGGDKAAHRLSFAQAEPQPIRCLDAAGLVAPQPRDTVVEGRQIAPTAAMFDDDALIWDRLHSRSCTWGVPGQPQLRIDFPDTAMLGVWQKPGANYLCIEPWAGVSDPAGFTGTIWEKPGIETLAPGACRAFRMDVTLVDR